MQDAAAPLLAVRGLSIDYPIAIGTVQAVRGIDIELGRGETLGLVGESGCGKSTLGLALLRLLREPGRIVAGSVLFEGRDVLAMGREELRKFRGEGAAMVFQNPLTSLDPLMRIEDHFAEAVIAHRPGVDRAAARAVAAAGLEELGIEAKRAKEYPYQLSGGMRQRVMIALALALRPSLLVADEPTTSLDVIVEAGFVDLLGRLRRERALSIILITHNLGLCAEIADKVAVMYGGKIAEIASAADIYHEPLHPYTEGLIGCVPNIDADQRRLVTMEGSPPDLVSPPPGCRFEPRCPRRMPRCAAAEPPLMDLGGGRKCACWLREGMKA